MYLNCKTYFSLRYGSFGTEELVQAAAENGAQTLALTNINCTADTWDFVDYCLKAGIKPVAGAEIRNGNEFCYLLLAKNNSGFLSINRFLSVHLQEKKLFPPRPVFDENVLVIYPLGKYAPETLTANEYIGVQITEVNKLFTLLKKADAAKFVIRHPVSFRNKTYYNVHRLLRAIDENIILSKQQPAHIAGAHETMLPPAALMQYFNQYPALITNTRAIDGAVQH